MRARYRRWFTFVVMLAALAVSGCTSFHEYVHNGFKVGPNYRRPPAAVAEHWIDQADLAVERDPAILCQWWTVFGDPKLNELIACTYRQNLTLKEAGFRILQARAVLGIAAGNLFPQRQNAFGDYRRSGVAIDPASAGFVSRYSDGWDFGFNLNWELDFWGRFRRAVAAADDRLQASVANYDGVLVTLLGDVAANYVRIRTDQERIRLLQFNVDKVQMEVWNRARLRSGIDLRTGEKRAEGGLITEADADVAESTLKQTVAAITQLEIDKRQAENLLCILLGVPPVDLTAMLGAGPIPTAPPQVVLGIPADLLRHRPDVRQAERQAAAQSEEIGIAQADLYPAFAINGNLGYQARNFPDLFKETAFNGSVGPSFQWNILNYGRIANNVRYQESGFQALVLVYQQTVLQANREVEDGLVTFLQSQRRARQLYEAVNAQAKAVDIAKARYLHGFGGESSFSTYTVYEQNLINAQDSSAQARGQIAQGLIAVYRALGGGWEIRLN
jgi:NodT family efflux transporter outer membrane factor (OMF) lipoprotein